MGHSEKRGERRYRARYIGPDGRERSQTFERKSDAEKFWKEQEASITRGDWIDPAMARTTFGEQEARWRQTKVALKASTLATYDSCLSVHILPKWADTRLSRIGYEDIAAWVAELTASGIAPSTVRQTFVVFRGVLAHAVRARRLSRNPALDVELPRIRKTDKRFLTHEQVDELADTSGEYGALVLTLAYTGLRWSEAVALRVRRLDLLRGRLEVAEGATEVRGTLVWDDPKSHRRRTVPVPRFLRDDLAAACAGKAPDDLVFTAPEGGPLRYRNFTRRAWRPAVAAAGLGGLTPHELRHTAASLAVASGATVKGVQRMLGHASAAMTLDVYAGLFDDELDAVADRMDAARATASRRPESAVLDWKSGAQDDRNAV